MIYRLLDNKNYFVRILLSVLRRYESKEEFTNMADSYVVAQGQQIQNAKLSQDMIKGHMARTDTAVNGNADIDAIGQVLTFEIIYGRRSSEADDFCAVPDVSGPDDYLLGMSVINRALAKDASEQDFWNHHEVLGIAKTVANTNLKGTGTAKDTFPVIRSGKTSYHWTNPYVGCPRNSLLRARIPTTEEQARRADIPHQANPQLPKGRYTLFAEPVDMRYVGYSAVACEQLRQAAEQGKLDVSSGHESSEGALYALSRLHVSMSHLFLYQLCMLRKTFRNLSIDDVNGYAQGYAAMGLVLDMFKNLDNAGNSAVSHAILATLAPRLSDHESLDADDRETAHDTMNAFEYLANTLTEWRWMNCRNIFARAYTAAPAGSGRVVDIGVLNNVY